MEYKLRINSRERYGMKCDCINVMISVKNICLTTFVEGCPNITENRTMWGSKKKEKGIKKVILENAWYECLHH